MDAKLLAWARRVKARGRSDCPHLVAGPSHFGTGPYDAIVMAGLGPAIHVLGFGGRAIVLSSGSRRATGSYNGCDAWMAGSSPAMTALKRRSAIATGHSTFRARRGVPVPPLWLFTDAVRLPDPLSAIRRLPPGLAGVVLRHDHVPERAALARAVARLCRARRLALSVAGDWRLAARLRAGVHLRAGSVPRGVAARVPRLTGSAHDARQAARCRRAGVGVIFLSPVFATASHPEAAALGPLRWAALARWAGPGAAALGGIGGRGVARLPPACCAIGAIDALLA